MIGIRISKPSSRRQLKASLGLLAGVLITGTLGFYLLGDSRRLLESVYLTVMIVTTVGLKDQYPSFNDAESVWSLVVMLVGVAAALYATGNLVAFLIGGEQKASLGGVSWRAGSSYFGITSSCAALAAWGELCVRP